MKDTTTRAACCSFDCNQGRNCPARATAGPAVTRAAGKALIGLVVVLSLLALCAGCERPADAAATKPPTKVIEAMPGWSFSAHVDPETGCQYLRMSGGRELTPRIAADGKTHMGCKGGAQ